MALSKEVVKQLEDMANKLRIDSVESTNAAKSGYRLLSTSFISQFSIVFLKLLVFLLREEKHFL